MTLKLSTALRNAMAGTVGLAGALEKGVIEIRTGPQPVTADAAATGTLLGTVTLGSGDFTPGSPTNGLTFAAATNGAAAKTGTWSFNGLADGVAGWFRFKGNAADAGGVSTTHARLDGAIAVSGGDMNMSNISVAAGAPNTIDVFQFTQPAQ